MGRGTIKQHRGLQPGELPRRYLRRHDDAGVHAELEHWADFPWDFDEYWDPWNQATDLDFEIERLWHDIVDVAFGAPIDLSSVAAPGRTAAACPRSTR